MSSCKPFCISLPFLKPVFWSWCKCYFLPMMQFLVCVYSQEVKVKPKLASASSSCTRLIFIFPHPVELCSSDVALLQLSTSSTGTVTGWFLCLLFGALPPQASG